MFPLMRFGMWENSAARIFLGYTGPTMLSARIADPGRDCFSDHPIESVERHRDQG